MAWGAVYGAITDANTGMRVTTATIVLDAGGGRTKATPYPDGAYLISAAPGISYKLIVSAPNYESHSRRLAVAGNTFTYVPVELKPVVVKTMTTWERILGLLRDPPPPVDPSELRKRPPRWRESTIRPKKTSGRKQRNPRR